MNPHQLACVALVLILLACVLAGTEARKKKSEVIRELPCTKQAEADVDVVFGRMSGYGNVSRPFPSSESELGQYCK